MKHNRMKETTSVVSALIFALVVSTELVICDKRINKIGGTGTLKKGGTKIAESDRVLYRFPVPEHKHYKY